VGVALSENELSAQITKLAESYDPIRDSDAAMMRSLLQGMMVATAALNKPSPPLSSLVKIRDVEQERDEFGDYLPYYVIVLQSGTRIRVTLEVE
jgi:hypothetical protein